MDKPKTGDSITVLIIAVTVIAIVVLLLRSGIFAPATNNIVILDTDPLVEIINAGEDNDSLKAMRQEIDEAAENLADQGFIVLRSDMVRAAPRELYVQIQE